MKPQLTKQPSEDEIDKITEIKNGQKVIGKARRQKPGEIGRTIYFLANGSEFIEDDAGEKLVEW